MLPRDVFQGIVDSIGFKFSLDVPVAVRHDVVVRRTSLNHIIFHNSAPGQAIVKSTVDCIHEIFYRNGSFFREQVKDHVPKALRCNPAAHDPALVCQNLCVLEVQVGRRGHINTAYIIL